MKKIISFFLALTAAGTIVASDTKIGAMWYNLDDATLSAEVTFKGDAADFYDNRYKGSITIPEKVSYQNTTYNVTSIGEKAFYGCKKSNFHYAP